MLKGAEGKLQALEARRVSGAASTPDELNEIGRYRTEAADARRQLRGVEREFRSDIDALQGWLVFLNVWLPPILVALAGLGVFAWRNRRRGGVA